MQKQDLSKLQTRKMKGLKRKLDTKPEEEKKPAESNGEANSEKSNGHLKKKAKTTANGSYDD
jgi:hypothetical protein